MNNIILISLVSLWMLGCGAAPAGDYQILSPNGNVSHSGPNLGIYEKYVTSFQTEGLMRNRQIGLNNIQITSGEVPEPKTTIAVCYDYGTTHIANRIVVNDAFWQKMTEVGREYTIFHELGHCLLHRSHTASTSSIMYPYIQSDTFYSNNRDYLLQEMFVSNIK